jgi:hypothetical protein
MTHNDDTSHSKTSSLQISHCTAKLWQNNCLDWLSFGIKNYIVVLTFPFLSEIGYVSDWEAA